MNNYSVKMKVDGTIKSSFQFVETKVLPNDIPITTPFTFSFIGDQVVLANDIKVGWNALGGKVEQGERWEDALKRESYEEAGIYISNIEVVGYILAIKEGDLTNSKFPAKSIMPVTISFVEKVEHNWTPMDTSSRGLFKFREAQELLSNRSDGTQMSEIFNFVQTYFKSKKYKIDFSYHPNVQFENVPVTQVMAVCFDKNGKVCVVRDYDEDFFSLVGGGSDLGEFPIDALKREALEEAQIEVEDIKLLGTVLVKFLDGNSCVSMFQHGRYICKIKKMGSFVPRENGFETVERTFIDVDDLQKTVMLLQNKSGEMIIKQLLEINSKPELD